MRKKLLVTDVLRKCFKVEFFVESGKYHIGVACAVTSFHPAFDLGQALVRRRVKP